MRNDADEYSMRDMESEEFPAKVFCGSCIPCPQDPRQGDSKIIECPRCRTLVKVSFVSRLGIDADSD
jgi:hypothetical protein